MSGAIRDLSQELAGGVVAGADADVVIIGSGPAGATAARLLAEAGKSVIVLEEGGDRTGEKLTQRDGEMYDQLYMDRGGRSTSDLSIAVLQGRVLGGGGVINASDVVVMHDDTLAFWQRAHGLTELTTNALAPHHEAALVDLHANRIEEHQLNRGNQLLRLGAQKLGVKGEVMLHNRVGCAGLGTCLIGCPLGAKQNPRMVSIPNAIAAGASFLCRARAVRIDDADRSIKRVQVRILDERGYHELGEIEVRAPVVILAANAVGSAHLALRSGLGGPHAGLHLSLQPQLPVVARFEESMASSRGIPQAFAITEHEHVDAAHGLWGFRVEAIMGTPGIVASLLPRVGQPAKQSMLDYNHLVASLVLVPDHPDGTVASTSKGRVSIEYAHAENHKQRLRAGAKLAARAYLAAGAREVEVPMHRSVIIKSERDLKNIDAIPFDACTAPLISAHQQGGLRMASSPERGSCDPSGKLWGTNGVYCFDSGIFPSSASSHTQAPIITVARFLTARLLAR